MSRILLFFVDVLSRDSNILELKQRFKQRPFTESKKLDTGQHYYYIVAGHAFIELTSLALQNQFVAHLPSSVTQTRNPSDIDHLESPLFLIIILSLFNRINPKRSITKPKLCIISRIKSFMKDRGKAYELFDNLEIKQR